MCGLCAVGMLLSDPDSFLRLPKGQGEELAAVRALGQAGGSKGSALRAGLRSGKLTCSLPGELS